MLRTLGLLAPLLLVLAGCDAFYEITGLPDPGETPGVSPNTPDPETGKAGLQQFKSAAEFQEYFNSQVSIQVHRTSFWGGAEPEMTDVAVDGSQADADAAPVAPSGAGGDDLGAEPTSNAGDDGAAGEDYSTTTTQEEGVQEADVVKNDGTYIYVLSDSMLHIVQADPGESLQRLSSTPLDGYGQDLYLLESQVVALTRPNVVYGMPEPLAAQGMIAPPFCYRSRVQVTVIDVADRSNPVIESTTWFEGDLSSSRMIGNVLHLILANYPDFFEPVIEYRNEQPTVADVDADADTILPNYAVTVAGGEPVSGNTVDWPNFYYPIDPDGYGMTMVVSLNINTPEDFHSVGVVAHPGNIYASTEALYLTDSSYDFWGDTRQLTDIYKFALADDGPALAAVGAVPGRILNQYSMSEYQGYLRVATTEGARGFWSNSTLGNGVYVLAEAGEELDIVGQTENIALGEEIKSARFSGSKGYLVTYEQIDPLFTLDLSDPTNPQVIGELKVPGFSTFIIEMDENHLLTVGEGALDDMFGWTQGVQLSIFDISDFANPQLAFTEHIGDPNAWSEALYNPKAFTYFAAEDLLALPVEIHGYGPVFEPDIEPLVDDRGEPGDADGDDVDEGTDDGDAGDPAGEAMPPPEEFYGLYVYRVTPENGFEFLGRMSTVLDDDRYYYGGFTRGVFMNANVFAAGERGVVGAPLTDVNSAPWQVVFPYSEPDYGSSGSSGEDTVTVSSEETAGGAGEGSDDIEGESASDAAG